MLYLTFCSSHFLVTGVLVSLGEARPPKAVATLWSTEEGEHLLVNTEGWKEGQQQQGRDSKYSKS